MRSYDEEEAARLNAEAWQTDLLKLNPDYCAWGPHEDYMAKEDGWDGRLIMKCWGDFGITLNDLNECVNFYFSVERESKECTVCDGSGWHAKAQEVVNTFYAHSNPERKQWCDKITEDEAAALVAAGRGGKKCVTAKDFNAANGDGRSILFSEGSHDAINRHILIQARLKRLGLPEKCEACDGHGYVFTAPAAHVSLTLWILHPRKGCSRGIEVSVVERGDLPAIFAWLREAAKRNAERFALIPEK